MFHRKTKDRDVLKDLGKQADILCEKHILIHATQDLHVISDQDQVI